MKTALVITTYNSTRPLRCSLESVARQSMMPDEIIVADDGSGDDTRRLIESFRPRFGERLIHVWHEDCGFRLSAIRNRAIAASRSDYIILVDGDVVLHRHFVNDHVRFARPGCFVTGARAYLDRNMTGKIYNAPADIPAVMSGGGMQRRQYALRIPLFSGLWAFHHSSSVRRMMGSNLAFWREDALRVNGFNEAFTGWGSEDREFGIRMLNAGLRRRSLRFGGIQYHLWHPVSQATHVREKENERLFQSIASSGLVRCEKGVDAYL